MFGIDLGTTNCALAWTGDRGAIRVYDIPQLIAPGETGRLPTLPSFLFSPEPSQETGNPAGAFVAGVFARDEGALIPSRQISSAKSWLANPRVDRTAPLLPWGTEGGPKLSPVEASARLLTHMRDAWNADRGRRDEDARLEHSEIALTVPASFDEEARELTAEAARLAGFDRLTLLEEPLAALYAYIAGHRRELRHAIPDGSLILVIDVGGGTTDFSLIRARIEDRQLTFERAAIGEHLLLGGDNLDLTLAAAVEQRIEPARLTLAQKQMLRRKCSAAKERLLLDDSVDRVPITILGSGRGVVAGNISTDLTAGDVRGALETGFLPITAPDDLPARDRRVGLRELGLPYETEPSITRHLAAFLTRAGHAEGTSMARPHAVLFNGGFFTPALARERILLALGTWFGSRPVVLENARPEAAVAVGAAFYARLRRQPDASRHLLIRAGSARSYFVGVQVADEGSRNGGSATTAVCVLPRGIEEGTRLEIDREFVVQTNRPAAFTLFSSRFRTDPLNALVPFSPDEELTRHAPLVTTLRFGKRSRSVPLPVRLSVTFTTTGTLELWCESMTTDHRWRLAFNLRGIESESEDEADTGAASESTVVISDDAVSVATARIREVFASGMPAASPNTLVGDLENILGHGKLAWPLSLLRTLADVLLQVEAGRKEGPAHEVRWLNLTGFCVRPGFGSALDEWRVSELRKVYVAGLAFPRETQNQVEWIVLWGRVSGGLTAAQQRELAQRTAGQLGLGSKKPARLNPQIEREAWRLLASLERLEAGQRERYGKDLLDRVVRDPRSATWSWAMGRVGARTPLYGPLNVVIPPAVAERWIERLLALRVVTADVASAVAQIGGLTGDPARDVSPEAARVQAARLMDLGFVDAAERLSRVVAADPSDAGRVFGESLPEGLHLPTQAGVKG